MQRFWIPVWSVRPGEEAEQRVLQYPVCLIVVTAEYARFYGVVPGLSTHDAGRRRLGRRA